MAPDRQPGGVLPRFGFSPEEARHRALLVYAAHVGTPRLFRDAPDLVPREEGYAAYRRNILSTLVPRDDAERT